MNYYYYRTTDDTLLRRSKIKNNATAILTVKRFDDIDSAVIISSVSKTVLYKAESLMRKYILFQCELSVLYCLAYTADDDN